LQIFNKSQRHWWISRKTFKSISIFNNASVFNCRHRKFCKDHISFARTAVFKISFQQWMKINRNNCSIRFKSPRDYYFRRFSITWRNFNFCIISAAFRENLNKIMNSYYGYSFFINIFFNIFINKNSFIFTCWILRSIFNISHNCIWNSFLRNRIRLNYFFINFRF